MNSTETQKIKSLFDRISPGYDRFNSLCSLGLDRSWRRRAVESLKPGMDVLDLGAGTGDLSFLATHRLQGKGHVMAVDISADMIALACKKNENQTYADMIEWVCRNVEEMPFDHRRFDAVISAFVLRNLRPVMSQVLSGVYESLKPGGVISLVDMTDPGNPWKRNIFFAYMRTVMRLWGRVLFGSFEPVRYLEQSIRGFYQADEFSNLLREKGFSGVRAIRMMAGTVTHYTGIKPNG